MVFKRQLQIVFLGHLAVELVRVNGKSVTFTDGRRADALDVGSRRSLRESMHLVQAIRLERLV